MNTDIKLRIKCHKGVNHFKQVEVVTGAHQLLSSEEAQKIWKEVKTKYKPLSIMPISLLLVYKDAADTLQGKSHLLKWEMADKLHESNCLSICVPPALWRAKRAPESLSKRASACAQCIHTEPWERMREESYEWRSVHNALHDNSQAYHIIFIEAPGCRTAANTFIMENECQHAHTQIDAIYVRWEDSNFEKRQWKTACIR